MSYDVLELRPYLDQEGFEETMILINGENLIDLVRGHEQPFADAEGHPELAGGYSGLPAKLMFLPSRHLLGEPSLDLTLNPDPTLPEPRAGLLGCDHCGEYGCWPLEARITVTPETVTWSNFEQPHRTEDIARVRSSRGFRRIRKHRWDYLDFGPFVFERAQYEAALSAARQPRW